MRANNEFLNDGETVWTAYQDAPVYQTTTESYEPKPEIPVVYSPPIIEQNPLPGEKPKPQIIYLSRANARPMPKPPLKDTTGQTPTTTGGQNLPATTGGQSVVLKPVEDDDDLIFGFKPTTVLLIGAGALGLFFVMGSEKGK